MAGAGFAAAPLVENAVYATLAVVALTMVGGSVGLVIGAWRRR
jgi:hypothetical protein